MSPFVAHVFRRRYNVTSGKILRAELVLHINTTRTDGRGDHSRNLAIMRVDGCVIAGEVVSDA